jgi:hypothetical protein
VSATPEDDVYVADLPLMSAESRLRNTRLYLALVEPLLQSELEERDNRFSELLHEVLHGDEPHPDYGEFAAAVALHKKDQLEDTQSELPRVLFNSLLAYTVSMLEVMLIEAQTEILRAKGRPPQKDSTRGFWDRLKAIQSLGVNVRISPTLDSRLRNVRLLRNTVIHDGGDTTSAQIRDALDAAEGLLTALRVSIISVELEAGDGGVHPRPARP